MLSWVEENVRARLADALKDSQAMSKVTYMKAWQH